MTETTSDVMPQADAAIAEPAEGEPTEDVTEEGRYIPYSGGSMGWFENSGVLNCELGNNYLFYTAMASDRVRSKQFQRHGDKFNRRGERTRYKRMTGVTLGSGKGAVRGTTRDISRHGIRLQFLEEVTLNKGDTAQIQIHADEQSETVLLETPAQVVWCERIGKIRPVWNVGLTFENLTDEQVQSMGQLLR